MKLTLSEYCENTEAEIISLIKSVLKRDFILFLREFEQILFLNETKHLVEI